MEITSSCKVDLAKNDVQSVWHTGAVGAAEAGSLRKQKVILLSWDRSRGIIFAGFSAAFLIWAAVFFPLIVK